MVKTGKTPSKLIDYLYSKVGSHHYDRIDMAFPEAERQKIVDRFKNSRVAQVAGVKVLGLDTADGFRFRLADNSWLLIRFSGTEPLLRIYAETTSPAGVKKLLEAGKALAGV